MSEIETTAPWAGPAPAALAKFAPGPFAALEDLTGTVSGIGGELTGLARTACAEALGLAPLPRPAADASAARRSVHPAARDVAAAFAEQFSLDVSAITPADRDALAAALGDMTREFVLAVYVADWAPRVRRALDELFAPAPWPEPAPTQASSLWPAIDAHLVAVARLSAVDPVTTELVRLRGARQHNCRMCKSLRSVPALRAGADESMFDAVDHYEGSALSARQQAALALADALIWQPAHLPADLLDAVRGHFTPAEAVELVLDIARNATNKIAVSLGSDEANVEDGVQTYEVRADGSIDYAARFTPADPDA